jgi:hypothetical protein
MTMATKIMQQGLRLATNEGRSVSLPRRRFVSEETVQALDELLEKARRGEVVGVAYAAMYRQREYSVRTCGDMHTNPTYCRGAVAALGDHISRQQWGA